MENPAKTQEMRDLDVSTAARGVWLVKVPKYLSENWKKCKESRQVGKLRISKSRVAGGKPEVIFSLDEEVARQDDQEEMKIPKNHKFVMTGVGRQTLAVLGAEAKDPADGICRETLTVEGKVIQRAECRPIADADYMLLKRANFEQCNAPTRQVVQLKKAVVNYKPTSAHASNLEFDLKNKKDEGKRMRQDKEKVLDILFAAFEKHQYYTLKDLINLTKQPVNYLKEILKEICTYNLKAPHRNMWELKAEFRHYKQPSLADDS